MGSTRGQDLHLPNQGNWVFYLYYMLHFGIRFYLKIRLNSMETPQKIKNGTAFWLSNPTDGNISKGTQNINLKEHKHPYVHCSSIYNHQDMEAAQVSISRWVEKTSMGHLHNGIPLNHKKKKRKENFTLFESMVGPGEHYTKWNKPVREMITISYLEDFGSVASLSLAPNMEKVEAHPVIFILRTNLIVWFNPQRIISLLVMFTIS